MNEDDFFKVGTFGGTIVSSALERQIDIVDKEFPTSTWNIYTFYCGDGENWAWIVTGKRSCHQKCRP